MSCFITVIAYVSADLFKESGILSFLSLVVHHILIFFLRFLFLSRYTSDLSFSAFPYSILLKICLPLRNPTLLPPRLLPVLRQCAMLGLVCSLPDLNLSSRPRGPPSTKKIVKSSEFINDEADEV